MNDIKTWTTYKMKDGSLIWGDYTYVDGPEFFEDIDEPAHVIKETWILQDSEEVIFHPSWWNEEDYNEWYGDDDD